LNPTAGALWTILETADKFFPSFFGIALLTIVTFGILVSTAFSKSSALVARAVAFAMVFVNTFSVGLHSYAWLTLLGFFFHMASLGSSNRQRLQEAADHGRFREMPEHVVGIQAMWDQIRLGISHLVWVTLTAPVVWFISAGLPRELRVYAAPVPIFNLGQDRGTLRTKARQFQLPRRCAREMAGAPAETKAFCLQCRADFPCRSARTAGCPANYEHFAGGLGGVQATFGQRPCGQCRSCFSTA